MDRIGPRAEVIQERQPQSPLTPALSDLSFHVMLLHIDISISVRSAYLPVLNSSFARTMESLCILERDCSERDD